VRELKRLTTLAGILDGEIEAGDAMLKAEREERGQIERLEREAQEAAHLVAERQHRFEWAYSVDTEAMHLLTVPTQHRVGSGKVWSVVLTAPAVYRIDIDRKLASTALAVDPFESARGAPCADISARFAAPIAKDSQLSTHAFSAA